MHTSSSTVVGTPVLRRWLLGLLSLLVGLAGSARHAQAQETRPLRRFTTHDGLPHESIRSTVRYAIPEGVTAADVSMRLYDVLGRQVRSLSLNAKAGRHQRRVDVSRLPSGVYVLRLRTDRTTRTQRLTIVK